MTGSASQLQPLPEADRTGEYVVPESTDRTIVYKNPNNNKVWLFDFEKGTRRAWTGLDWTVQEDGSIAYDTSTLQGHTVAWWQRRFQIGEESPPYPRHSNRPQKTKPSYTFSPSGLLVDTETGKSIPSVAVAMAEYRERDQNTSSRPTPDRQYLAGGVYPQDFTELLPLLRDYSSSDATDSDIWAHYVELRHTRGMTKNQEILNNWAVGADGTTASVDADAFQALDPIKKHLETFRSYFPNASAADLRGSISGALMEGLTTKKDFYDYLLNDSRKFNSFDSTGYKPFEVEKPEEEGPTESIPLVEGIPLEDMHRIFGSEGVHTDEKMRDLWKEYQSQTNILDTEDLLHWIEITQGNAQDTQVLNPDSARAKYEAGLAAQAAAAATAATDTSPPDTSPDNQPDTSPPDTSGSGTGSHLTPGAAATQPAEDTSPVTPDTPTPAEDTTTQPTTQPHYHFNNHATTVPVITTPTQSQVMSNSSSVQPGDFLIVARF